MASRPVWRGHLRLALVTCPVALYNARHDRGSIRFNMINPKTGNRIKMATLDAVTGEELERSSLVKGYEYKKNEYIIVTNEDLDSVKVESSDMMNVEKFVETTSIDPVFFDASYFMAPDGRAGEEVYAVLQQAIAKIGMTALSRVVIQQRERTIAIRPYGTGLMAHTLYEERDVNSSADLFRDTGHLKLDTQMIDLATMLIKRQSGKYDPSDLEDRYETRLRAMLDAKIAGHTPAEVPSRPVDDTNVIDLMAALKRSLGHSPNAQPAVKPKSAKDRAAERARKQPAFKLPIAGGKATAGQMEPAESSHKAAVTTRPSRKRA
jgi:DNA end-binding protein Ku